MKLIFQLLKCVLGFVASLIACGLFLAWGFFLPAHPAQDTVVLASLIGTAMVSASVIGAASFFPALIVIMITEAWKLRGFVVHMAAGGGLAFFLWTFGGEAGAEDIRPGSSVALAAGFIAGLVYWVIAGRTAGCWLASSAEQRSQDDV